MDEIENVMEQRQQRIEELKEEIEEIEKANDDLAEKISELLGGFK